MEYTLEELNKILEKHKRWLNDEPYGKRANLQFADLRWAELTFKDLTNTNLSNAKLNWVNTEDMKGYTVYCVQMPTSRENARLSYWKDLDVWTTGCFQGTKEELINSINKTHKDNEKIRNRYFKAIEFIESMASEK